MKKINKIFDDLSILIFVLMVVVVIVQVVCRYCFKLSVPWTEELSRLLFIYVGFTGTAIAVRENELIVVDVPYSPLETAMRSMAKEVWLQDNERPWHDAFPGLRCI